MGAGRTQSEHSADRWAELGRVWISEEARIEATHRPVLEALMIALDPQPGERVLDIGCGPGGSLFRISDAVGPTGRVVGIDVAPPVVARARQRAAEEGSENVTVHHADAGERPLAPGTFDALVSLFGVMFFDQPARAFRVLSANLRPGGRLCFAAWGPRGQNPCFTLPAQVAAKVLGPSPADDPDAPGPFGLQNAARAVSHLSAAGLQDVSARTVAVDLTPPGGAAEFARMQMALGPAAARMRETGTIEDAGIRAAVGGALTRAFEAFETDGRLRIPAVIHLYTARAGG